MGERDCCGKRCYSSKEKARRATAKIGQTLRVYHCDACSAYHVTKNRGRRREHEEDAC